jgi:hypothetical protein
VWDGVPGNFGDEGGVYLSPFLCPLQVVVTPSLQCPLVLVWGGGSVGLGRWCEEIETGHFVVQNSRKHPSR